MENNSFKVNNTNSFSDSNQISISQPGLQDINAKILHFIDQIGDKILQNLQIYEGQQIEQYKNDLLKTQQQFYKLRHDRDQQSIKNDIINCKMKMQATFNQKVKQSQKGANLYEKMKVQLKQMNQKEKQLKKELQFMKKQIKKTKLQGQFLDQQLKALTKQQKDKINSTIFIDKTNIILKSQQKNLESKGLQQKEQARIITKIQQIKDYMKQIPDDLNYFQTKIAQIIAQQGGIIRQKFKRTYLEEILSQQQSKRYIYQQYFDCKDQIQKI